MTDPSSIQSAPPAPEQPTAVDALPGLEAVGPGGRDMRRKRLPALSFLLRMDTLRRCARVVSLVALDAAGIYLAIFGALELKAQVRGRPGVSETASSAWHFATFAFLITALLFARAGLYADRASRPGLRAIVSSLFQVALVALVYAVVSGQQFQSFYIFWGSLLFATIVVSALRWGYDRISGAILRAAGYHRRAVLVGSGAQIEAVAHALKGSTASPSPIAVVGFISLTPRPSNGLRSLGRLDELSEIIQREEIDEVIIADPDFPQQRAVDVVDTCHQRGVRVRVAPSTMEILVHRADFVPGEAVPLFELRSPQFEGLDFAVKRTFDLVGSVFLLLVLSPLLAGCAAAVWLTSKGSILYRSHRPGIGGEPFACLKFRTMYSDADERQAEIEHLNEADGALFKIRDDPRITPVGRALRKFSLDELPQLWNVLRGDMSLVGPRPLPQRDYDQLEEWHRKRYLVLPGITGLWQVSGRSELDFDDLVRLDFLYLEHWSVSLDLSILVKTIPAVLRGRGAF